jgi:hypothetical protein
MERQTERAPAACRGSRDEWRRLAIEAGMLAFLIGLALIFVAAAPS